MRTNNQQHAYLAPHCSSSKKLKEALSYLKCSQLKPEQKLVNNPTILDTEQVCSKVQETVPLPAEDENEEIFHPKNYSYYFDDSDEDSEFEYVPNDSEEDLISIGSNDEESDNEEPLNPITHKPPFWYSNEDSQHIEEIMKKYQETLIRADEYKNRSHQPFVARVRRCNATTGDVFQTYDVVLICNNQRLPDPSSPIPEINEIRLLTSWDEDGIPFKFFILGDDQIRFWERKLEDVDPSYIRCVPDYFGQNPLDISQSRFVFSCSNEYDDIYYSNLPWNSTPFHSFVKPRFSRNDDEPEFPKEIRFCD